MQLEKTKDGIELVNGALKANPFINEDLLQEIATVIKTDCHLILHLYQGSSEDL